MIAPPERNMLVCALAHPIPRLEIGKGEALLFHQFLFVGSPSLIDMSLTPYVPSQQARTAMHMAALHSRVKILEDLIEAGADADAKDKVVASLTPAPCPARCPYSLALL